MSADNRPRKDDTMSDDTLTPAAAIRAFAFGTPATATPPTPATAAPAPTTAPATAPAPSAPPASPAPSGEPPPVLSPEAVTMASWVKEDLAAGKISAEQAANIFDDLGVPLDQRATPADTRTDEHKLIDTQFPAAKPEEYQIRYADPGQVAPPMSAEMKAFDSSARTWLSQAEFPANLGNSLITTIAKTAQATKHMNATQLEEYGYAEYAKLERVYGSELEKKLQAAGRMVEALDAKQPGLKNLLKSKGLGDNAMVASLLIQQAERWHARRKGR